MKKRITNIQVLSSVLAANNDLGVNLAEAVARAVQNNSTAELATLDVTDLRNLFLNVYNKFGKQVIFDVLGGWANDLTQMFLRDASETGEFTELMAVNNDPAKNMRKYQLDDHFGNNPFGVYYPEIANDILKIDDGVQWVQTIALDEMRKAVISKYGILDTISSLIVDSINKKADIYMYNRTKEMLNKIGLNLVIGEVSNEATGKTAFKIILRTAGKFAEPKTIFNEAGIIASTNKKDAVLLLTNETKANFDVDVMASLLNSDKINLASKIGRYESFDLNEYNTYTINIDQTTGAESVTTTPHEITNVVGYLVDKDKLRTEIFLKATEAIRNPKNLGTNYWHTCILKAGILTFLNGLKLIAKPNAPKVETGSDTKAYAVTSDLNVKLYYTLDGTTPTKNSTPFTTGVSVGANETFKAIAYCKDTDTYSDVSTLS
jgi:hypothetical protein